MIGFLICLLSALVSISMAFYHTFNDGNDGMIGGYLLLFLILLASSLGCLHDCPYCQKETKYAENEEVIIENVIYPQIDTTYTMHDNITDTLYTIKYFKKENK